MCNWDKYKKPPINICPQKFCFLWHEDISRCGEAFGPCRRSTKDMNDIDSYEPCEPKLKKHDLPWFYFIANADSLVEEFKKKYLKEANKLWGDNQ